MKNASFHSFEMFVIPVHKKYPTWSLIVKRSHLDSAIPIILRIKISGVMVISAGINANQVAKKKQRWQHYKNNQQSYKTYFLVCVTAELAFWTTASFADSSCSEQVFRLQFIKKKDFQFNDK